jgi:gluconolactonase
MFQWLLVCSMLAAALMVFAAADSPSSSPASPATRPAGSPIADGATPVKLADGFIWTEGCTSDREGNIFFVDQNNDKIMKWEFDKTSNDPLKGTLTTFLHPSGYSNGMSFDNNGNLISCADERNELWSIAAPFPAAFPAGAASFKPADLHITVLIKNYNGKLLNGPNDVWVIPKGPLAGGMFLTDPLYPRKWWGELRPANDHTLQQPGKFVYFFSPDHKTLTPVITDFRAPNGIIGTPDGKTLYVSDIEAHHTFSYTLHDDGTLGDKKLLFNAGSDGMTIDSDGNLYTTIGSPHTGLQIWSKEGKLLDHLPIGCGNCCFGGKDGNILFICAVHEIYGIRMKTHRVGPQ